MKKNIFFIIIPFITLFSCSSSQKLTIEKNESITSFVRLTDKQFVQSFNSKKDMVVFIGDSLCSSCAIAHNYIENYISNTNNLIYFLDTEDFNICKNESNIENFTSSTLLFISNSKVIDSFTYSKKIYSSQPYFNSEMSKRISSKSILNINDFTKENYSSWASMYRFDFNNYSTLENIVSSQNKKIMISNTYNPFLDSTYKEEYIKSNYYSFLDLNKITENLFSELNKTNINDNYFEIIK